MKKLLIVLLFFVAAHSMAQTTNAFIEPYRLAVASNKTTNLVFPFAIQSVDRGSGEVLVQKADGAENILHIKAARDSFTETNLTVITTDGKLYSFLVGYDPAPAHLNITFNREGASEANAWFKISGKVVGKKKIFHHVKAEHADMQLRLRGLYINNDVFYFQFVLSNRSNVSYDIDAIRFTIKDKQKSKRTASQESELQSLYQYGNAKAVKGKAVNSFVVAVPKFTLPDNKYLHIHLLEKNGGRDLELRLKNGKLMDAKVIL